MKIKWDPKKQAKLRKERDIDFEEIKALLEDQKYLAILENPNNPEQTIFLLNYKSYIHVLIAKIEEEQIIFKTCYPSRKFHNRRGEFL
jgi:uncharacterized DUF497 family protein